MVAHVSYALDAACPEAYDNSVQWDNYDKRLTDSVKMRLPDGAQLRSIDLFRYPWAIDDNTYDIIWLSHIAEHIPHEPRLDTTFANSGHSLAEQMYFNDFDGWFIFFGECWRILKPGGKLHVLAPYGHSAAGYIDPTHTRYLLPGVFSYFVPNPDAPFDYALPYGFQQINNEQNTTLGDGAIMQFVGKSSEIVASLNNAVDAMRELPDTERGQVLRQQAASRVRALQDLLNDYSLRHFNQISEFIYSFTPVK